MVRSSEANALTGDLLTIDSDTMQIRNLLTFVLGRHTYALPIEVIVQIIEMVTLTPLPRANRVIEGLINVRGTVAPVVNLGWLLSAEPTPKALHTPIVLVSVAGRMVGLIVDRVAEVLNVQADLVVSPEEVLPEGLRAAPFLMGLVRMPQSPVMLLDLETLFTSRVEGIAEALDEALSPFADLPLTEAAMSGDVETGSVESAE